MQWVRTNREHPCPVCGRDHYCSVSTDEQVVFCTEEPSDRPSKNDDVPGWLHKLASAASNGHPRKMGRPITRYAIKDAAGNVVAIHCRRELGGGKKRMWWEMPDGTAKLVGLTPADLPLYGIDLLPDAESAKSVFVCEGEKATDALRGLDLVAVGTVTGADGTPRADMLRPLLGFDICLWPDNDADGKGQRHMDRVGQALRRLGGSARILTWADAPAKGDAFDFVAAGLGLEELRTMYRAAAVVEEQDEPTTDLAAGDTGRVHGHVMSDLTPEDVRWVWPGRIPLAKLTVLDGDPGLGKSAVTLDLAARVTRGDAMPDGARGDVVEPAGVLLLTAEDGLRDTVLPRLKAAGADLARVTAIEEIEDDKGERQMPAIPRDLEEIERWIRRHDVRLMIVDPLIAFLGDSEETNSWRDQDIRRALGPFGHMLERTLCAGLLIRHLNKTTGGNALYRGGGSIGIIGAARSGLLIAKDGDDETGRRRVLVPTKANLSAPATALAYHIEQVVSGSIRIAWEGETDHTAVGLLAEPLSEEERGALTDAVEFLRQELYGDPVPTAEIKRRAREADISARTLERARSRLHVVAEKTHGPRGPWCLRLPIIVGANGRAHGGDDA